MLAHRKLTAAPPPPLPRRLIRLAWLTRAVGGGRHGRSVRPGRRRCTQGGNLLNMLYKKERLEENVARMYLAECVLAIEQVHKIGFAHRYVA